MDSGGLASPKSAEWLPDKRPRESNSVYEFQRHFSGQFIWWGWSFCSLQAFIWLGEAHPCYGRQYVLPRVHHFNCFHSQNILQGDTLTVIENILMLLKLTFFFPTELFLFSITLRPNQDRPCFESFFLEDPALAFIQSYPSPQGKTKE